MASSGTPWLTQEAYDRLKNELDHISGPYRQEIVDRIEAARDEGDLKENAGYHAAREEQSKNEGRIQELKALLENAEVGESAADDGIVKPGMLVECKLAGNTMKFVLGSREIAEGAGVDVYSVASPLGSAIEGHKAGETVTYKAPNGKDIQVELISVAPYNG
ncbi:MAG TPA: transcription elongation factor GreA [Enteractinococcus helveticum]|uniref:Transcription elongation factor GreA n=1 Tax=Enteractinococcus helveticum TaxID=1837282 RepID=A0A921K6I0_9MICC|nr:transcription elongation factor GreA [Enteractinococcus helveticum]HJF13447.1 transcription elongation factor GreA [Enteractinococcus helveticum]